MTKRFKWPRVFQGTKRHKKNFREKTGSGKSGKNPDMKFLIFRTRFWEWTLQIIVLWWNEDFFFCDSHKFWHFWHLNFWLYIHKFLKNQLDIYFLVIWDIFGFIITVLYDNGFFYSQGLYVVFQPTVPPPLFPCPHGLWMTPKLVSSSARHALWVQCIN